MNQSPNPEMEEPNDLHPSRFEEEKQKLSLEKLRLENKELEKKIEEIELNISRKHLPGKWDIIKTVVTWVGVIAPILISVYAFYYQRKDELEQRKAEIRIRDDVEIRKIVEQSKSEGPASLIRLAAYGQNALPHLVGKIYGQPPGNLNGPQEKSIFGIDLENKKTLLPDSSTWPNSSIYAIETIKLIGPEHLSLASKEYLYRQGIDAFQRLSKWIIPIESVLQQEKISIDSICLKQYTRVSRSIRNRDYNQLELRKEVWYGIIKQSSKQSEYKMFNEQEIALLLRTVKILKSLQEIIEEQPKWNNTISFLEKTILCFPTYDQIFPEERR